MELLRYPKGREGLLPIYGVGDAADRSETVSDMNHLELSSFAFHKITPIGMDIRIFFYIKQ